MSSSGSADEETSSIIQIAKLDRLALASEIKIIPEGGWGWMICGAAFVTQFIVMGIHNSFGILYTTLLEEYKRSKAETAWVGSVSVGVMYVFGPITSGLSERLGCRVVALLGGLLCFLGMLMTSFVSDLTKLYVTYGVLWGIGTSFCYFPTLTAPGEYFCKRLSLVNGIVTAGSGIGTLTFGPVLQYILQRYGFSTSLRILSGVSLLLLLAALTYRPFRSPLEELFEVKRQPRPFFDFSVWQNKAFCVYTAAVAIFMLGYFIPYVHLVSHVEGLGISPSKAALLIGFMSIASTISRLGFGKFSDHPRVNRLFMTQLAILGFGVTTTLSPLARSYASLLTVVVALGLFDGLYVVLIAVLNTDIVGVHKLPAAIGSLYGVISFTLTLGPPFAGFMYDMLNSYHTAFYICGATTTLSSCLMFLIPWLMPNQQGGVFRRDSCQSRLEGLLNSQSSTPCTRKHSRSFFARRSVKSRSLDSGNSSLSSPVTGEISLCEADRAEQEYLTGFTIDNEADVATDGASNEKSSFSMDTSINTVFNASMSHRGSITKFLLQQQLQSQSRASTPLSGSRRGSSQSPMGLQSGGSSSRSSMSSSLGFRTSSSSPSRGKGSFKRSLSESRQGSFEVSEESSSEESFEQISSEPEAEMDTLSLGQLFNEDTRRESGESTVVGSNWESGRSTVIAGTPKVFQSGMKDDDMLHLLAARLLQAMRGREQDDCGEERESTV